MSRPWTPEEDEELIRRLEEQRPTASELALRFDRSRNSVISRVHRLGHEWGRTAEETSMLARVAGRIRARQKRQQWRREQSSTSST